MKTYTITMTRDRSKSSSSATGTIQELVERYGYTLECGKSWEHEAGNSKINLKPKGIKTLIKNLNNAVNNSAANGYAGEHYNAEA